MKTLKLKKKVVANLSNSNLETVFGGADTTTDLTPFSKKCNVPSALCTASAKCPTTNPTNSTIPQCGYISGDYAQCVTIKECILA